MAEELWANHREQQCPCIAQEFRLLMFVDLADEFDAGTIKQGFDRRPEIGFVGTVDLSRDLQRNAERPRNHSGAIRSFLWGDAAEKGNVPVVWFDDRAVQIDGEAMINGRREIRIRHWAALIVGDRDKRHVIEPDIERQQIRQILAAVQGGHRAVRDRSKQWELKLIDMEVQD